MDMYLLLRNNKQSGPYSLEELKSMGLKAYDLVWLEGKSAAWRYPSELQELKAFAPVVEEQPFDRFYKKPAAAATSVAEPVAPLPSIPVVVEVEKPAPATPLYTGEPSAVPGKRIIYVTMPAGRTPAPVREIPRETTPVRESFPVRETPRESTRPATAPAASAGAPDPAHLAYASGVSVAAGTSGVDRPASTNPGEDYSSQLPSLEQQLEAVSPRSSNRRRSKEQRERIMRTLAISACILALLAAGIFIGLSLNKQQLGLSKEIATKSEAKNADHPILQPASQTLPVSSTTPALTAATPEKAKDSVPEIIEQSTTAVPPVTKPTHPATPKEKASAKKGAILPPAIKKDSVAATNPAHRDAVHRADIVEAKPDNKGDKEAAKPSINSQVSVGANNYSVGTFGGINDLQLTVTNRSVYPLDVVVVEVQYIQANKKVYRTENLYFRNIGAGSALMQEAPKSSRGIKVQYKIITISSKDLGLSYSGI